MSERVLDGLLTRGLIPHERARTALQDAQRLGIDPARLVVERGWIADTTYADVAAEVLGIERLRLERVVVDPTAVGPVDETWAREEGLLPLLLSPDGGEAHVAAIRPENLRGLDSLRFQLGRRLRLGIVGHGEFERLVRHVFSGENLDRSGDVGPAPTPTRNERDALLSTMQQNRQAADALRAVFELCVERGLLSYQEFVNRTRED